jgi:hypothetical protein
MRTLILMILHATLAAAQFTEGSVKVLGQRLSIPHAVKNAPYQATATTEVKQTLLDGNEIFRKTLAKMARDSQGRVRLEQVEPEMNRMILVEDPEARTGFSYSPGTGRLQMYGTKKTGAVRMPTAQGTPMGKSVLDGIAVEGTRLITVIPAGQIGNAKPIEIVDESWYSPELQLIMKSQHSDPRSGVVTYRLSAVERKEPDPKLFAVPDGAQIQR